MRSFHLSTVILLTLRGGLHAIAQYRQRYGEQHHAGGGQKRRSNQRRDHQACQEAQTQLQGVLQRGGAACCLREWTQRLRHNDRVNRPVRNGHHAERDQNFGQTGTRISPELYIPCGISGAIQHWAGCSSSKVILAVNTDAEAPMVTKATYAVVGDMHEVVPAIVERLRNR